MKNTKSIFCIGKELKRILKRSFANVNETYNQKEIIKSLLGLSKFLGLNHYEKALFIKQNRGSGYEKCTQYNSSCGSEWNW